MDREHVAAHSQRERWLGRLALLVGAVGCLLAGLTVPLAYAIGLRGLMALDLGVLIGFAYSPIGAFVAWRQPRNAVGWLLLSVGLALALVTFASTYARYAFLSAPGSPLPAAGALSVLGETAWLPGTVILLTFLPLLFPNGKLLSAHWRPVAWASGSLLLLFPATIITFWPGRGLPIITDPNRVLEGTLLQTVPIFPILLLCGLASVISLLVRFGRSTGTERQQIKWFAYGAALTLASTSLLLAVQRSELPSRWAVVSFLSFTVAFALPLAVAIAILRHHIWDIDIIIRRTLVYTAVTALLAVVFYGTVLSLQRLFTSLTGQESPVAVVASTLVIAALFSPIRSGVQNFVDRRFHRRKYDAQQVVSDFGAIARDETDIERLACGLTMAVEETMSPSSISIWLTRN